MGVKSKGEKHGTEKVKIAFLKDEIFSWSFIFVEFIYLFYLFVVWQKPFNIFFSISIFIYSPRRK